jgi:hypothetical protein
LAKTLDGPDNCITLKRRDRPAVHCELRASEPSVLHPGLVADRACRVAAAEIRDLRSRGRRDLLWNPSNRARGKGFPLWNVGRSRPGFVVMLTRPGCGREMSTQRMSWLQVEVLGHPSSIGGREGSPEDGQVTAKSQQKLAYGVERVAHFACRHPGMNASQGIPRIRPKCSSV